MAVLNLVQLITSISGDRDLLELGRHDGIPIVLPAQFLREIQA